MARRYVDLSMTLSNDVISDPPFLKPHIDYETHAGGHMFPLEHPESVALQVLELIKKQLPI